MGLDDNYMERLGFIDVDKWWKWVEDFDIWFEKEKWNGKENSSGRECFWIGKEVELGFNSKVRESNYCKWFVNDNEINFNWDSLLVYKYGIGSELKDHVDRDVFKNEVIIINLCKDLVGFRYGGKVNWLRDGELIKINNKISHGVCKVNSIRYSLSFRKIK